LSASTWAHSAFAKDESDFAEEYRPRKGEQEGKGKGRPQRPTTSRGEKDSRTKRTREGSEREVRKGEREKERERKKAVQELLKSSGIDSETTTTTILL